MARPIVNLYEESDSGITEMMDGPWREIRVLDLLPAGTAALASRDEEHAGFVLGGTVELAVPDEEPFRLEKGSAFALPVPGEGVLTAGSDGVRILLITMNVGHA